MRPGSTLLAHRRAAATAIAVGVLAVLPTLLGGVPRTFIDFDDHSYVVDNPAVNAGLSVAGVRWAFTSVHVANWHPLTWLSHMLDVSLFGLDARGHHLTSLLIHGVNAALLFLALLRLTGRRWPSALAAALFGVHPLRVESVAWVAERKDVLAGFFFMLVLLAWERHARRGAVGRRSLLVVAALLALGLMAKPTLVTAPFVLLLLDVWPLGRGAAGVRSGRPAALRGLVVEKWPLFALAAASSGITLLAQGTSGAIVGARAIDPGLRVANAVTSAAAYLAGALWPFDLAMYYPYPFAGIPGAKTAVAAAVLAGLTAVAALQVRRLPFLALGWCWFLGMLVPVVGLVQVGRQAMADRYTYLPLVGVSVALAWLAAAGRGRRAAPAIPGLCAAAVAALAAMSAVQTGYWADSETLFNRTLAVTRDNALVHNNLGAALHAQGRGAEALAHFEEALRIRPSYADAMVNRGSTLIDLGRFPEATDALRAALRLAPDATVHYYLGQALAAQGRPGDAEASLREAIRLRPDYPEAAALLGVVLQALGRHDEALAAFSVAVGGGLGPKAAALAHAGVGVSLIRLGRTAEATPWLERAVALDPGSATAAHHLGVTRLLAGRNQEAADLFAAVLEREPDNVDARSFRAVALAQLGRPGEAALEYGIVARARPEDPEVRFNLGLALRLAGRETEALAAFREALRLRPGFEAAAEALAGR